MKKMCFITNSYPFGAGESTFVLPELECMKDHFDITLVSCGVGEKSADVPDNVKLLHYTRSKAGRLLGCIFCLFDPLFYQELPKARKAGGLKGIWRSMIHASDARHFGRWLKKNDIRPDIVYSFWHTAPLFGAIRNKKSLGNPVIVSRAHGYDLYHFRVPEGYQPFKQYCDQHIDRVYLISQAGYDYYMSNYSVSDPPKCSLRYLGADNDRVSPYEYSSVLRIYSCSNLIDIKRVDMIIEAIALISGPVEWIHFGGGCLEADLRALASQKLDHLPDCNYTFTGAVPNNELRSYVASHPFDCFVTASSTEGLPVTIIEAFSFGIPAVATDAGGIKEIVTTETGILLPVDITPQQLADAVMQIKSLTPEQTHAMRKAAYEKWKTTFVASENAQRFCDELLALCDNR